MKRIIILLIMISILSGCAVAIPAAFVAGATAGGSLLYDERGIKTMLQDHNAATYAQNWINNDPKLKDKAHINVDVFNHIALLVGQAPTPDLRQRAYQIVQRTKNISRIYNEVTVSKPTSILRRTDDSWITTKVKSAMLAKKGLNSTQLKVLTEDGIVYLMGVVNQQQALIASNVAKKISGVKEVVKVFQYT